MVKKLAVLITNVVVKMDIVVQIRNSVIPVKDAKPIMVFVVVVKT